MSAPAIDTHGFMMPNGKHKGERITRVPVSYLKWMVQSRHSLAAQASAELDRRGTTTPDLDVSGHAIDSASLRLRQQWMATGGGDGEGLHAWLCRMATDALANGEQRGDKIAHAGILFVFEQDGCWPVLKTVMREKAA